MHYPRWHVRLFPSYRRAERRQIPVNVPSNYQARRPGWVKKKSMFLRSRIIRTESSKYLPNYTFTKPSFTVSSIALAVSFQKFYVHSASFLCVTKQRESVLTCFECFSYNLFVTCLCCQSQSHCTLLCSVSLFIFPTFIPIYFCLSVFLTDCLSFAFISHSFSRQILFGLLNFLRRCFFFSIAFLTISVPILSAYPLYPHIFILSVSGTYNACYCELRCWLHAKWFEFSVCCSCSGSMENYFCLFLFYIKVTSL